MFSVLKKKKAMEVSEVSRMKPCARSNTKQEC